MAQIDLTKRPKINHTKGQVVCLTKEGDETSKKLSKVFFGTSWAGERGRSVDLDASIICYTEDYRECETIYFAHKIANNHSIKHSGDDLHGGSTNLVDNETIEINLNLVQPNAHFLVATLNSYSGEPFHRLKNIACRIYTGNLGNPDEILCKYQMDKDDSFKNKKACVLGYFYRSDDGWKFKADGRTSGNTRISGIVDGIGRDAIRNITTTSTTTSTASPSANRKGWFARFMDFIFEFFDA